jgi:hypothetical protein
MKPAGKTKDNKSGAAARPNKKASRQPTSPARIRSKPPKIPLIPKMRPFINMNIAEASPNIKPPARDDQGVK